MLQPPWLALWSPIILQQEDSRRWRDETVMTTQMKLQAKYTVSCCISTTDSWSVELYPLCAHTSQFARAAEQLKCTNPKPFTTTPLSSVQNTLETLCI